MHLSTAGVDRQSFSVLLVLCETTNIKQQKQKIYIYIRVRVRERLSATHGHVIGQGLLPGEALFPAAVAGNAKSF